MGLPRYAGEVRSFRATETAEGPLYAVVHADLEEGSFEAEVVDGAGNRYALLRNYRTVALPNKVDTTPLKSLQAVVA